MPPDGTERRLAELEEGHKIINDKLDRILSTIDADRSERKINAVALEGELKNINTKLDAKASAEALAKLSGDLAFKVQGVDKDLQTKASATDMSKVIGAVEKLPTNVSLFVGLFSFLVAVFVATGVAKHLGW